MNTNKNLVIGAFSSYTADDLMPFVKSLLNTGFNGDLCLLYSNCDTETVQRLQSEGVKMIPFRYKGNPKWNPLCLKWRYFKRFMPFIPAWGRRWILSRITRMPTARFIHIRDFLIGAQKRYSHVFVCDVRDIIFQMDPFQEKLPAQLFRAYEEDPRTPIGKDSEFNGKWIESLLGHRILKSLVDYPILCCGTILADVESMIGYLDEYCRVLASAESLMLTEDQPILNFLVRMHPERLNGLDVVSNGEKEVLTLGWMDPQSIRWDEHSGVILNSAGNPIPVIHQYDRDPHVADCLMRSIERTP
jgi:hypothetical protein